MNVISSPKHLVLMQTLSVHVQLNTYTPFDSVNTGVRQMQTRKFHRPVSVLFLSTSYDRWKKKSFCTRLKELSVLVKPLTLC